MDYKAAIDFIQSFPDMERGTAPSNGLSMTLDSMKSLLRRLGDPQDGRHTVHITGSKGKGSTATMIASVLSRCGLQTAMYTSPHLHSYTERIAIGMQPISEALFAEAVWNIKSAAEEEHRGGGGPLSTFGLITAAFFWLACRELTSKDWQVVEVGLGGTLDATNVFSKKDVAVITAISLEHTKILGATAAEIAANKAGIITPGCVTVLAPQQDVQVVSVVEKRCLEVGSTLVNVASQYKTQSDVHNSEHQLCVIEGPYGTQRLRLPLLGRHQVDNAATALAALEVVREHGVAISDHKILDGFANAGINGRVEVLTDDPVIVVDGAHNRESAAALRSAIQECFTFKNCFVVLGLNGDKDASGILSELAPIATKLIATRSESLRAMEPEAIAEAWMSITSADASVGGNGPTESAGQIGKKSTASGVGSADIAASGVAVTGSVSQAVDLALKAADPDDLICVTGSLYVVAEAREHILRSAR